MNSRILEFIEEFDFRYPLFLTCAIKPACRLIKGYYSNSGVFKMYLFLSYRVIISSTNIPRSRSWLRSSWNFTFPSIKDGVKLWMRRVWSLYNWCQNCIAQVWVRPTCFQQHGWFFYTLALCALQVSMALRLNSDCGVMSAFVFIKHTSNHCLVLFPCPYLTAHQSQACVFLNFRA